MLSYVFLSILMTHFNVAQRFEMIDFGENIFVITSPCYVLSLRLRNEYKDRLTDHQANINLLVKTHTFTTIKAVTVFEIKQGNYPSIEESCMVIPFNRPPLAYVVNVLALL